MLINTVQSMITKRLDIIKCKFFKLVDLQYFPTTEFYHCDLMDNHQTQIIENLLISLGKYPIFSVQFLGYLPLSVNTQISSQSNKCPHRKFKTLRFRWFGPSFLLNVFIFTAGIVFLFVFTKYVHESGAFEKFRKFPSDFIILGIFTGCWLSNVITNRIHGLLHVRGTQKFWNFHCYELGKISTCFYEQSEQVRNLKRQIRHLFIRCIILMLLPAISVILNELVLINILGVSSPTLVEEQRKNSAVGAISSIFGIYFSYGHILFGVWVTFFIKLYILLLEWIIGEVEKFRMFSLYKDNFNILDGVSDAYDNLTDLIQYFNQFMGSRLVTEVVINIIWILGCMYFDIATWAVGNIGSSITNICAALLAIHTLYLYGNEGEKLKKGRLDLIRILSRIKIHDLMESERVKVKVCCMIFFFNE